MVSNVYLKKTENGTLAIKKKYVLKASQLINIEQEKMTKSTWIIGTNNMS